MRCWDKAQESSNAWNNAGTGHRPLCELNYTPEKATQHRYFEALQVIPSSISPGIVGLSRDKGAIRDPRRSFIRCPISFVRV